MKNSQLFVDCPFVCHLHKNFSFESVFLIENLFLILKKYVKKNALPHPFYVNRKPPNTVYNILIFELKVKRLHHYFIFQKIVAMVV